MPITKIRGDLHFRGGTIDSESIKNQSITSDDLAPNSFNGGVFIDGSIPPIKLDIPELLQSIAGDGLEYNPGTIKIDVIGGGSATTDASDLVTGTLNDARLSANVTLLGNIFNGPNQLVKLDSLGKLPALDGSNLTNVAASPTGFVDLEVPSGSVNGSNVAFTLASTPIAGSVHLFVGGMLQRPGAGNDYTISGSSITMAFAPSSGSTILASYRIIS